MGRSMTGERRSTSPRTTSSTTALTTTASTEASTDVTQPEEIPEDWPLLEILVPVAGMGVAIIAIKVNDSFVNWMVSFYLILIFI